MDVLSIEMNLQDGLLDGSGPPAGLPAARRERPADRRGGFARVVTRDRSRIASRV
jgi:hypothetical protein